METYLEKKNWIVFACSSPVILLSGKQGPMLALAYLLAGYCIMRLEGVQNKFSKTRSSVCCAMESSFYMLFFNSHQMYISM
ncbi:unnamed protein product [Brassica napus]|uniref:(rape) hypothetical protein n=1 Tax=Brassica napus TaxID=3708 RepID=A0A816JN99_BRANA|nr:unnamed protein product [Brassica napus]